VLWGVAGALAIADVTLWILSARRSGASGHASLLPSTDGALVGVRF